MSFLRSIILAFLLLVTVSGFFGTAFAEPPTARDLDLRYDATNGTTREGYIETFKGGFGNFFF